MRLKSWDGGSIYMKIEEREGVSLRGERDCVYVIFSPREWKLFGCFVMSIGLKFL